MLPTRTESSDRRAHSPRVALITLCITQITSWGALFYAFPVLNSSIASDTGWSATAVTGAFSSGLAVSAIAGIPVGRLLDKHGPRPVMTIGSVLASASVAFIALAPTPLWFVMAWAFAGVAQACVFYKPAFAALTVWYGDERVRALTTLTLVAGLASTVFAPLTATLAENLTWRATYLVLGAILAVVTIPAHAFGLKHPWPHNSGTGDSARRTTGQTTAARNTMRSAAFILLATATAMATFALFAATFFLVPLLTGRGMDTTTAAWALGLCGAGQLLGRLGYGTLSRRTTPVTRTTLILTLSALAIAATTAIGTPVAAVFSVVIILGAARGAFTLLEATAVSDRWGTAGFGLLYGVFSAPSTTAIAIGPAAGSLLAGWLGGHTSLFAALSALTLIAAALATFARAPIGCAHIST